MTEWTGVLHAPPDTATPLDTALLSPLTLAPSSGVQWGLERTLRALRELGDPHLAYPSLHVTGTNGKGSVASTWASVLRAQGLDVGLYTSPHLIDFNERFNVNGRPAPIEELANVVRAVREVSPEAALTYFEAATVVAFEYFARVGVDVVVAEVGLGGRLDATNVLQPEVSAITNISLDHAAFLGATVAQIAAEKAGIIKAGVPVFTGEADPEITEILRSVAQAAGAPFHRVPPGCEHRVEHVSLRGTRLVVETGSWGRLELETPLVGAHQGANVALAVRALEALPEALRPEREAVIRGVAEVCWPGRLQWATVDGAPWVFDVAHNAAGVEALISSLRVLEPRPPVVMLVGVLADKDWRSMIPGLVRGATCAILTQPPSATGDRQWDSVAAAAELNRAEITAVPDFSDALIEARMRAGAGSVVVTGSTYTVGDAMKALRINPFAGDGEPAAPPLDSHA